MKKTLNKGFTLIELLVVIAIIGILASVILASLNTARAKGADAAIKADLANARAQAELFFDNQSPNSYMGVCNAITSAGGIASMIADAATKGGVTYAPGTGTTSPTTASSPTAAACHHTGTAWAASVPTKSVTGYFCVDSTGTSKQTANLLGASAVVCS